VNIDSQALMDQQLGFLKDSKPDSQVNQYKSTQQLRFNALRQESKDITLTTEEGDTVTISALDEFKASYMSYDYTGSVKGGTTSVNSQEFTAATNNSLQISVQGDLNEEEKNDVAEILGKLDEIMTSLVKGDIESVLKGTFGLMDEADTINSIDAVLQFHQQISMEQQTMTQMTGQPPKPADSGKENGNGNDPILSAANLVAKISNQVMQLIDQSGVQAEDFKDSMNNMFKDFLNQLAADQTDPNSQLKAGLLEQLQASLNQSIA